VHIIASTVVTTVKNHKYLFAKFSEKCYMNFKVNSDKIEEDIYLFAGNKLPDVVMKSFVTKIVIKFFIIDDPRLRVEGFNSIRIIWYPVVFLVIGKYKHFHQSISPDKKNTIPFFRKNPVSSKEQPDFRDFRTGKERT